MPHTNNYSNIQHTTTTIHTIQCNHTTNTNTGHTNTTIDVYIYTHTYYFLARTRTRLAGLEDVVADGAERLRGPMVGLRRNPA